MDSRTIETELNSLIDSLDEHVTVEDVGGTLLELRDLVRNNNQVEAAGVEPSVAAEAVPDSGSPYAGPEHEAQIEGCVASLERMCQNETHAWNLWNFLASDTGAIQHALLGAWRIAAPIDVNEERAEAVRETARYLKRIAPKGLVNRADVLADMEIAAKRLGAGIHANGRDRAWDNSREEARA